MTLHKEHEIHTQTQFHHHYQRQTYIPLPSTPPTAITKNPKECTRNPQPHPKIQIHQQPSTTITTSHKKSKWMYKLPPPLPKPHQPQPKIQTHQHKCIGNTNHKHSKPKLWILRSETQITKLDIEMNRFGKRDEREKKRLKEKPIYKGRKEREKQRRLDLGWAWTDLIVACGGCLWW